MTSETAGVSPLQGKPSEKGTPEESKTPPLGEEKPNLSTDIEKNTELLSSSSSTGDKNGDVLQDIESDVTKECEPESQTCSENKDNSNESGEENSTAQTVESSQPVNTAPQDPVSAAAESVTNSTDECSLRSEPDVEIASAPTTKILSSDEAKSNNVDTPSNSNEDCQTSTEEAESLGSPESIESESSLNSGSSMETPSSGSPDDSKDWYDPAAAAGGTSGAYEGEDDDITSRAAIALAAVAVAANAQHSSPSAAAQAARALAPGIIPGAGMSPRRNEDMKLVSLKDVKHYLKNKGSNSLVIQKLADGENDAFLQHVLLLEFFRVDDDTGQEVPTSPSAASESESGGDCNLGGDSRGVKEDDGVFDEELAALAAERVRSMLGVIGGAYDSLVGLLPSVSQSESLENEADAEFDGIEIPPIIPDLLPPCASTSSDATAEFFRECAGPCELEETTKQDDGGDSEKADDSQSSKATGDAKSSETGHSSASSVLSSMLTSVKRSSIGTPRASLTGVFRKRSRRNVAADKNDRGSLKRNESRDDDLAEGEYSVLIEREMLGLTVENVLERTVVRTVLPGGAAKSAGAQVGSLIVKVGNVKTINLTHFETIDELRQSQRPLRLVMRQISTDALSLAREEMGRLIRGAGFGMITGGAYGADEVLQQAQDAAVSGKRTSTRRPQIETYSRVLHERWTCDDMTNPDATELPIHKAAEKLVWILTLLVYGLEREAGLAPSDTAKQTESLREKQRHHHHDAKDYADASKSISKVLLDFMKKNVSVDNEAQGEEASSSSIPMHNTMIRRGRKLPPPPPPPPPPPRGTRTVGSSPSVVPNKPLIQIGDVLHRTYTFLADPTSPPAALLRGEVIAFLCDVLDIDTAMELCEEENASSTAGENAEKAGPISDLGSAGSLLKLIILNCSMMRSPDCGMHDSDEHEYILNEQKRRFGYKKQFSRVDAHRLHAGNRFLAVVHRLAASRSLSARVTACSLGPVLWGHLDFPHQLQLRGVVTRALHDVDVIVRKSTATVLHEIAELVFDSRAVPWLVLMCERAMTDPEPQLRSAAMTLTWHLAEHLPNAFLGDASQGSRSLRRLPPRTDPTFAEVYLLQCKLLPVATRLAEDRAPSVRLAVAAQCDRLCNALGEHWSSVIIDVLQALLGDSDERVRCEAILCVPRLVETVIESSRDGPTDGGVEVLQALLPVSIKLQKDLRSPVRAALATTAGQLLTLLVGLDSLEEIPAPNCSGELAEVPAEPVRKYKRYVDETLIPLVQQLLHDTDPEVTSSALRAVTNASRGTVREMRTRRTCSEADDDTMSLSSFHSMSSMEKKEPVFIPVLSEEQVLRLLPTLADLANSNKWRVRQGAVEIVPALLGCTNELDTRSRIAELCICLMRDHVDAVRRTAAECLCLGAGTLGSHGEGKSREWISSIVIPHTRECANSSDSKQRMLSLKMIEVMLMHGVGTVGSASSSFGGEADQASPVQELLDVAVSLSTDRVANVRLNVGRVMGNILHVLDDSELSLVINALKHQLEEEQKQPFGADRDVLYFAKRAIARSQARLEEGSMSTPDTMGRD